MLKKVYLQKIATLLRTRKTKGVDHRQFAMGDRLKIEFVFRSNQGVVFQILICLLIFFFADFPGAAGAITREGIALVTVFQSIRLIVYRMAKLNPLVFLKRFNFFNVHSMINTSVWGLTCMASIFATGTVGVGLTIIFMCVGFISALGYSTAPVLKLQRLYISFLAAPMFVGLVFEANRSRNWLPVLLFSMHVLYSFVIGTRQNEALNVILDQQDRIQKDLKSAKEIQQSLLPPKKQKFGKYDLEFFYLPCEELSGDFFQITLRGNLLYTGVFDVTSHGTASAQVTYLLKGIFNKVFVDIENEISLTLAAQQVADEYALLKLDYGVSLFAGKLDLQTGNLEYLTSNFPGPISVAAGRSTFAPQMQNPLIDRLAYKPKSVFVSSNLALKEDIFVFTDGCYEFSNPVTKKPFGLRRLGQLFSQNLGSNWQEKIWQELKAHSRGEDFDDDITILRISQTSV